ncbi:hypothetical protein B0T24DRAFT_616689, partial [Lasiosphaeria ovina]
MFSKHDASREPSPHIGESDGGNFACLPLNTSLKNELDDLKTEIRRLQAEKGEPESETAPTPPPTSPAPSVDETIQPKAKVEQYGDFADDISDTSVDPAPPGSKSEYHGYTLATLEMMKRGEEGKNSTGAAPEAEAASVDVEMTGSPPAPQQYQTSDPSATQVNPHSTTADVAYPALPKPYRIPYPLLNPPRPLEHISTVDAPRTEHNYTSSVGSADPHEREPSQQETQPPQIEHRTRASYRSPWVEHEHELELETTPTARPSPPPPPPIPSTTSSGFLRSPHAQELRAATTTSGSTIQSPYAHGNQPPASEHKTRRAATPSPPSTRSTSSSGFLQSPHAQELRAATTSSSDIPRSAWSVARQTSMSDIPRSAWAMERKSRGGGGDGSCSLKHAREKKAEMRTRLKEKQDKKKVRFVLSGQESDSGSGSGSGSG